MLMTGSEPTGSSSVKPTVHCAISGCLRPDQDYSIPGLMLSYLKTDDPNESYAVRYSDFETEH